MLTVGLSTITDGTHHKITLKYYDQFLPCGSHIMSADLSIYKPVCYLDNNRISRCFID